MSQTEKIKYLLDEVRRLEELLSGVQDAEIYPVSFFNQSFDLTRELLKELYQLEADQVETFRKQMEARQALLKESLPEPEPVSQLIPEKEPVETIEIIPTEEILEPEEEPVIPETEESEPVSPVRNEKTIEELLREYAPAPQPLVPEKSTASLGDIIEKKNLADFRKAFSLNDRFYFLRELFDGDDARMNEAITDMNEINSLEESLDYINNKMRWNPEDKPVADFILLLEKRFS